MRGRADVPFWNDGQPGQAHDPPWPPRDTAWRHGRLQPQRPPSAHLL